MAVPSRIDELVTAIAGKYDDTTVVFKAGKTQINAYNKQRSILMVRQSGVLRFVAAPAAYAFGTPVGGAGTLTRQRFEREELFEVTLRAEDEDRLDAMFDRFVNAVFEIAGPNAFETHNAYQWYGEDSKHGGDWNRRNPSIKLLLAFRLKSRSQTLPFAVLATTEATVTELTEDVVVTIPSP